MLPYFPTLYKDELLYSWFARYHVHSANISPKQTMNELFGNKSSIAIPDLPIRLDEVYKRISHFKGPDVDEWIKNHTFYNYYTTFSTAENKSRLLLAMKSNDSQFLHLFLGIMASSIKENMYFLYCPKCFQKDLLMKGEPYWRLSHQLPGVLICLDHNEFLLKSSVKFRGDNKHEYVAANHFNCSFTEIDGLASEGIKYKEHAIALAQQIQWTMKNDTNFILESIQRPYKYLLHKNGFASVNGSINQRLLANQFISYYGSDFLEKVQSDIKIDSQSCWLKTITRKHRKVFHPIRHLLLIHFLGGNIDSFYQCNECKPLPFGEGPYPCLNPAANHYEKRIIQNVTISTCTDTRRPVGTFQCDCGFVYSRRGPDITHLDQFKIGRVKQFGQVWINKLHYLMKVENRNFTDISKLLKCDIGTVRKYAKTTSLTFTESKITVLKQIKEKRRIWEQLLADKPECSITGLRKLDPSLYSWFYRNDREWLKEHSPKQRNKNISSKIDWNLRDEELLKEVFLVIANLYWSEKPVYVNINRIGKEVGKLYLLQKHLDKLPKTKKYLLKNVETIQEFQIRRVKWAATEIFKQKGFVSEWEIKRMAGLREHVEPEVSELIKCLINRNYVLEEGEFGFVED